MFKSPYNIKGILNIKNTQQTVKKRTIQEPYLSQLKCQGSILIWNCSLHWLSWSRASQAAKFHWPGVPLRFLDHYFPCLGHFRALYLLHYFCRWFRCCIKYLFTCLFLGHSGARELMGVGCQQSTALGRDTAEQRHYWQPSDTKLRVLGPNGPMLQHTVA